MCFFLQKRSWHKTNLAIRYHYAKKIEDNIQGPRVQV